MPCLPKNLINKSERKKTKLFYVRWRLVIHGCIDGYSRRVVYLKCADYNRAETVLVFFMEQVRTTGLPSRIRTDRGGENVPAAAFISTSTERYRSWQCHNWTKRSQPKNRKTMA